MIWFPPRVRDHVNKRNKHRPGWDFDAWSIRAVSLAEEAASRIASISGARACVMDIGCGTAITSIFLARKVSAKELHLLDGDGTASRKVGFTGSSAWDDARIGAALAVQNLPDTVVYNYTGKFPDYVMADLIVSLKSWGHHYPIPVYASDVRKSLVPGGMVVVDIRKGTAGLSDMGHAGFTLHGLIGGSSKRDRAVFEHDD